VIKRNRRLFIVLTKNKTNSNTVKLQMLLLVKGINVLEACLYLYSLYLLYLCYLGYFCYTWILIIHV